MMDTIFAQSSAQGKAGVAVFRISGPKSLEALNILLQNNSTPLIPNMMYYKKLYLPETNELIDEGMVVYFKAPNSFTGEDVVELHLHGSIAISKLIIATLFDINGFRVAEAGEFTKRAFLNGKFDLTAAEGLADLIEAETILQHKQAIKQKSGELENLYSSWRKNLLHVIALLEAYIDFPDEEIPDEVLDQVTAIVDNIKSSITSHLSDNRKGERLRSGLKLSILGEPNVGKSSLINFLLQREAAIVSDIPGTTRDIVEGHIDIAGYPIILQDTAGIRQSSDIIEQEGIKRSFRAAKEADIKIIIYDAANQNTMDTLKDYIDEYTILVANKIDLITSTVISKNIPENDLEHIINSISISLKYHTGTGDLITAITNMAEKLAGLQEEPYITRARHRHQLQQALAALESFDIHNDLVLATEDVRMTIRFLSNITGIITVDEILGEIFSKFCIGK